MNGIQLPNFILFKIKCIEFVGIFLGFFVVVLAAVQFLPGCEVLGTSCSLQQDNK